MVRVRFEVFGRVQGVFFRKYTKMKADSLNIVGWVRNTRDGSVQGVVVGNEKAVDAMKKWLREEGSPQSRIERAVFDVDEDSEEEFEGFEIRK